MRGMLPNIISLFPEKNRQETVGYIAINYFWVMLIGKKYHRIDFEQFKLMVKKYF